MTKITRVTTTRIGFFASQRVFPFNRINRSTYAHCVSEQGTLTIVRRSSAKSKSVTGGNFESSPPAHNPDTSYLSSQSVDLEEILDNVDLTTDSLPAVDTPDACDKAALRYYIVRQTGVNGKLQI